jgi:hypothetical protein
MEDTGTQQPGQVVTPTPPKSDKTPQQPPEPPAKAPEAPQPASPTEPASQSEKQFFKPDEPDELSPKPPEPGKLGAKSAQTITWTASEFVAHAKSLGWYVGLAAAAAVLTAAIFLITRDFVSVGVVIIGAILLGIYGGHQPRQLQYQLDTSGLGIGQKHFGYDQFRSFSIIPEGAFDSIVFMPLKRFAIPTTIYFAPEDKDKIVTMLVDRVPFEERGHDAIDRLMQRIRF